MATESGKVVLQIDAKTGSAIANLSRLANQMNKVKKSTKETGEAARKSSETLKESFAAAEGYVGLGGVTSVFAGAGAGAGAAVLAIESVGKIFEHGMEKWDQHLQSLIELNKKSLDKQSKIVDLSVDKGLPQGYLSGAISQFTRLSPEEAEKITVDYVSAMKKQETKAFIKDINTITDVRFKGPGDGLDKELGKYSGFLGGDIGNLLYLANETKIPIKNLVGMSRMSGGKMNINKEDLKRLETVTGLGREDVLNRLASSGGDVKNFMGLFKSYKAIFTSFEFSELARKKVLEATKLSDAEKLESAKTRAEREVKKQPKYYERLYNIARGSYRMGKLDDSEYNQILGQLDQGAFDTYEEGLDEIITEAQNLPTFTRKLDKIIAPNRHERFKQEFESYESGGTLKEIKGELEKITDALTQDNKKSAKAASAGERR